MTGESEYVQLRLRRATVDAMREILDLVDGSKQEPDTRLLDWTYTDFVEDMTGRQDLQLKSDLGNDSTATKRKNCIQYMENHPVKPVCFRPPDEASYIRHMAYRRSYEEMGPFAAEQYRKATNSLLGFLRVPRWETTKKRVRAPRNPVPRIPPLELVPLFWTQLPCEYRTHRVTLQHVAHLGFHAGLAPPSELCGLRLDDIEWDSNTLVVRRVKKRGESRVVYGLDPEVFEWLDRYIEHHRVRTSAPEVFVTASGTPWRPGRLGNILAEAGKRIWAPFRCYSMRHYFINEHLREHGDIYLTARVAGCSVATLMSSYIDHRWQQRHAR